MIMVLNERPTRNACPVNNITCQFVHIIDFTLLSLTRQLFNPRFHKHEWHLWRVWEKVYICPKETSKGRTSMTPVNLNTTLPLWTWFTRTHEPFIWLWRDLYEWQQFYILCLLVTRGCQSVRRRIFPSSRRPWHSFRTKAWPAVDTHSQSCGWLARPRFCLPWNWKLQGPFLFEDRKQKQLFDDALRLTLLAATFTKFQASADKHSVAWT